MKLETALPRRTRTQARRLPALGLGRLVLGPVAALASCGRWWRTLSHCKTAQVLAWLDYRLRVIYYCSPFHRFIEAAESATPENIHMTPPLLWPGDKARGKALMAGTFSFMGRDVAMGKNVQWAPPGTGQAWLCALHGFTWLGDLRAVNTTDARQHAREMVADWMVQCGAFHPLRWQPVVLSNRLIAWLSHGAWLLDGADRHFKAAFLQSLARHADHLPKVLLWDSPGADLMRNLKALIYSGLCLPGRQTTYLEALSLLREQLVAQVYPDGGHAERSPTLHARVLEDLLDIHATILKAGQTPPAELDQVLDQMALVLAFYRHPDGRLAQFNDGEEGSSPHLDALQERCGLAEAVPANLAYTGYTRLSFPEEKGGITVLMDTGTIGDTPVTSHTHAGTLAFELSAGGERVLTNSGTYAYDHPLRETLRGTAAHNTVTIAGQNSAEVWGTGYLGRRPRRVAVHLREEAGTGMGVEAVHDGYRHLRATHTRRLFLGADGTDLRGEDVIDMHKPLPVAAHFHLYPGVGYKLLSQTQAQLTTPGGQELLLRVKGGQLMDADAQYSPALGVLTPTRKLVLRAPAGKEKRLTLNWAIKVVK